MKRRFALLAALSASLVMGLARPARAQTTGQTGSVERFQPSVAGDAMFGVPSAAIGGHLVPRVAVITDFAYKPLSVEYNGVRSSIVSHQLFLHVNASFALFDRLLIYADMPFALAQGGDSPVVAGVRFNSPSKPQVGDLRLGARGRIYGGFWDPFQISVGGYVFVPSAPKGSYAGDGAVRGEPHLLISGRAPYFTYSLSAGAMLHGSSRPHSFELRAGAAVVIGKEIAQIGPEIYVGAPFSKDILGEANGQTITVASRAQVELLFGAKFRPVRFLVIGVGAGPGLTQGWGTPKALAVASIGYEPLPDKPNDADRDGDGILDKDDACPTVKGIKNDDPKKNGCPPDQDDDGILDVDDACPTVKGIKSDDPKKNGCPPDQDGDGIADDEDACPTVPGVKDPDPKKNGCPKDQDGDGILDNEDACPTVPGVKDPDPKKNGCPPDQDGDGIFDKDDACPKEPGVKDPDPKKNGCPVVVVTRTEIVINRQVQFRFGKSSLDQTVDPVSDDLLQEVRRAIDEHPEIELIEVQGHADNVGPEPYNRQLSDARAKAVRDWLVSRGVRADKLVAKGYGTSKPIAPNASEEGRQRNRRVQFLIQKRKE